MDIVIWRNTVNLYSPLSALMCSDYTAHQRYGKTNAAIAVDKQSDFMPPRTRPHNREPWTTSAGAMHVSPASPIAALWDAWRARFVCGNRLSSVHRSAGFTIGRASPTYRRNLSRQHRHPPTAHRTFRGTGSSDRAGDHDRDIVSYINRNVIFETRNLIVI